MTIACCVDGRVSVEGVAGLGSIGFSLLAGTEDLVVHRQQLSSRSDGQRYGAQCIGVEFEIGGSNRHQAFDILANPNPQQRPR